MSHGDDVLAMVAGGALVTASFFAKTFYAAKGIQGGLSNRVIATWKGRLLFRVIGGAMILVGLLHLLFYDH